jgi:hypothetical protein
MKVSVYYRHKKSDWVLNYVVEPSHFFEADIFLESRDKIYSDWKFVFNNNELIHKSNQSSIGMNDCIRNFIQNEIRKMKLERI